MECQCWCNSVFPMLLFWHWTYSDPTVVCQYRLPLLSLWWTSCFKCCTSTFVPKVAPLMCHSWPTKGMLAGPLSIRGCTPSGPGDLSVRSLTIFFLIISGVTMISVSGSEIGTSPSCGMWSVSSSVNTLENCWLRVWAFSLSVVALLPSLFWRSGILALVVLYKLTYLQKALLLF